MDRFRGRSYGIRLRPASRTVQRQQRGAFRAMQTDLSLPSRHTPGRSYLPVSHMHIFSTALCALVQACADQGSPRGVPPVAHMP